MFIYNEAHPVQGTPHAYYEKTFCPECVQIHWVEIPPFELDPICNGKDYFPKDDSAHYTKRSGRGIELIAYDRVSMYNALQAAKV